MPTPPVKQSSTQGLSTHGLPTTPSTSELLSQFPCAESIYKYHQAVFRSRNPTYSDSTASHSMFFPPKATTFSGIPPQHHGHQRPRPSPAVQGRPQGQSYISLSSSDQPWYRSKESMRNWLQTRAEEEKTKQEAEKTMQENLRLEQRRIELDILREALKSGNLPPILPWALAPMVASGTLAQTAQELVKQFTLLSQEGQHSQVLRQEFSDQCGSDATSRNKDSRFAANLSPQNKRRYDRHLESAQEPGLWTTCTPNMFGHSQTLSRPGQCSAQAASNIAPKPRDVHNQHNRHLNSSLFVHQWHPPGTEALYGRGLNQHETTSNTYKSHENEARYKLPVSSTMIGESRKNCNVAKLQRSGTPQPPPALKLGGFSEPLPDLKKGQKRRKADVSSFRESSHGPHRYVHHYHMENLERMADGTFISHFNHNSGLIDKHLRKDSGMPSSLEEDQVFYMNSIGTDTCAQRRRWSQ